MDTSRPAGSLIGPDYTFFHKDGESIFDLFPGDPDYFPGCPLKSSGPEPIRSFGNPLFFLPQRPAGDLRKQDGIYIPLLLPPAAGPPTRRPFFLIPIGQPVPVFRRLMYGRNPMNPNPHRISSRDLRDENHAATRKGKGRYFSNPHFDLRLRILRDRDSGSVE